MLTKPAKITFTNTDQSSLPSSPMSDLTAPPQQTTASQTIDLILYGNSYKSSGQGGREGVEIYIHWQSDLTVSWLGMPCNFVSTVEVPTTIWQTLRTHTQKPIIAAIL